LFRVPALVKLMTTILPPRTKLKQRIIDRRIKRDKVSMCKEINGWRHEW
jgi:hypothetical protein